MEISLKRNYGFELIFKAENVSVTEDIESRTYPNNEDGKVDYSKPPKRDVSTPAIEQIVSLLDDMIYYRVADFDSTNLIERLIDKLPKEAHDKFMMKAHNAYTEIND